MSTSVSALIIAIVGVVGTLTASMVSQILSARTRREELELQHLHRHDEYDREQQQNTLTNKRNCYIALLSESRRYRLELMKYLYAINERTVDKDATERLEEARLAFNISISETQLTGALTVLDSLDPIRDALSQYYTAIRNLEREELESTALNSSFEEIKTNLLKLWDEWPRLRAMMRNDLGVKD
jgi:hypothetical protein